MARLSFTPSPGISQVIDQLKTVTGIKTATGVISMALSEWNQLTRENRRLEAELYEAKSLLNELATAEKRRREVLDRIVHHPLIND